MTLFEECLQALGDRADVLSEEKTVSYFCELEQRFPFTPWARIDWAKVHVNKQVENEDDIYDWLNAQGIEDKAIILMWDYAGVPAVKTDLDSALAAFEDVEAVSSNTYMYCPATGYVIEFFHDGIYTIGLCDK